MMSASTATGSSAPLIQHQQQIPSTPGSGETNNTNHHSHQHVPTRDGSSSANNNISIMSSISGAECPSSSSRFNEYSSTSESSSSSSDILDDGTSSDSSSTTSGSDQELDHEGQPQDATDTDRRTQTFGDRIQHHNDINNDGGVNHDPEINGCSIIEQNSSSRIPSGVPEDNNHTGITSTSSHVNHGSHADDEDDEHPPEPPPRHAPLRRTSVNGHNDSGQDTPLVPSSSGVLQDNNPVRNGSSKDVMSKSGKRANRSVSAASSLLKHGTRGHHRSRHSHNITNGLVTISRLPSIPERCGSSGTYRYQRVESDESLPPNFEARMDSYGRIFYIDHLNRTTTWIKPTISNGTSNNSSNATTRGNLNSSENNNNNYPKGHPGYHPPLSDAKRSRQQLDERYNSIRRTISGRGGSRVKSRPPIPVPLTSGIGSPDVTTPVASSSTGSSHASSGINVSNGNSNPQLLTSSSNSHVKLANSSITPQTEPNSTAPKLDVPDGGVFSRPSVEDECDPWSTGFGVNSPIQPMHPHQQHQRHSVTSSSGNRQSGAGGHPVLCASTPAPPARSTSTSGSSSSCATSSSSNVHQNPLSATLSVPVTSCLSRVPPAPTATHVSSGLSSSGPPVAVSSSSSSTVVTIHAPVAEPPIPTELSHVNQLPAVKFLQRSDFFNLLHLNDDAFAHYNRTSPLKHMISKIRKDSSNTAFFRYQHNRDLVLFLNKFSDVSKALPSGWDSKLDRNGKTFFIDHTTKTTTFIDPRLPIEIPLMSNPHTRPIGGLSGPSRRRVSAPVANAPEQQQQSVTSLIGAMISALDPSPSSSHTQLQQPMQQQPVPHPRPPNTMIQGLTGQINPTGNSNNWTNVTNAHISSSSSSSAPPVIPSSSAQITPLSSMTESIPTAYNELVVAFLRQPNIIDILKERQPQLSKNQSLKDKVGKIRTDGISALHRLSDDVELTMLLSLFENEIMSYVPVVTTSSASVIQYQQQAQQQQLIQQQQQQQQNSQESSGPVICSGGSQVPSVEPSPPVLVTRAPVGAVSALNIRSVASPVGPQRRDFEHKLRNFYRKLNSKGYGLGPNKLKLSIRRDHLLEDAFTKIMSINSKKELQKSRLYISFAGEEGLDYGGPSRYLLSHHHVSYV